MVETAAGSGAAPWESIELEIVRVLEAMNELRESPDYERHRLTERSPKFSDETVGRHLESLETELATLQCEAKKLSGEIEKLTEPHLGLTRVSCHIRSKTSASISTGRVINVVRNSRRASRFRQTMGGSAQTTCP